VFSARTHNEGVQSVLDRADVAYAMMQDEDCSKHVGPTLQDYEVLEQDLKGYVDQ